jgi:hypothetical protein
MILAAVVLVVVERRVCTNDLLAFASLHYRFSVFVLVVGGWLGFLSGGQRPDGTRERNKESNEGRGSVFRFLFSGVCTE